jgi:AcrR family transcriptional regulator
MSGVVSDRTFVNRFRSSSPLDAEAIVRAACSIVAREGLDKLTMRRLGRELDVEAMSIYHHVANKGELLRLVAESTLRPIDDMAPSSSPYDSLGEFCRRLRQILIGEPELAPLIIRDSTAVVLRSAGATALGAQLRTNGFDIVATRWVLESFVGFVVGHCMVAITNQTVADDDAAFETGLRFMLAGLREELGD